MKKSLRHSTRRFVSRGWGDGRSRRANSRFLAPIRERSGGGGIRKLTECEHGGLKRGSVRIKAVHLGPRHRLHDPMNVDWLATCMRPKADVGLIGMKKLRNHF